MNKKQILISVFAIVAVAVLVVGATTSYFSDIETSTGNTFTAGSIDLMIDNTCSYNGVSTSTCTWNLKDLTVEKFFNFFDLKPGDWGEDTVSVHVYDNDAWACVTFKNLKNNDNTCTEPEKADDPHQDGNCGITNPGEPAGELAQNLSFVFWADNGDNIWAGTSTEPILMQGPASNLVGATTTYALADSDENNVGNPGPNHPLIGSQTYHIGKVWCFGTITMIPGQHPACNGTQVNNASQSDSLTGDIEFYAVQSRNNLGFQCESLD